MIFDFHCFLNFISVVILFFLHMLSIDIFQRQQHDVGTDNVAFEADEGLTKPGDLSPQYVSDHFIYK